VCVSLYFDLDATNWASREKITVTTTKTDMTNLAKPLWSNVTCNLIFSYLFYVINKFLKAKDTKKLVEINLKLIDIEIVSIRLKTVLAVHLRISRTTDFNKILFLSKSIPNRTYRFYLSHWEFYLNYFHSLLNIKDYLFIFNLETIIQNTHKNFPLHCLTNLD